MGHCFTRGGVAICCVGTARVTLRVNLNGHAGAVLRSTFFHVANMVPISLTVRRVGGFVIGSCNGGNRSIMGGGCTTISHNNRCGRLAISPT